MAPRCRRVMSSENLSYSIGYALPFVLIALFLLPRFWLAHRSRGGFSKLCAALGAPTAAHDGIAQVMIGEREVRVMLASDSKRAAFEALVYGHAGPSPEQLDGLSFPAVAIGRAGIAVFLCESSLPVSFALSRESALDSLAKKSGFAHEHQTGDAAFDKSVYVSCDDAQFARSYLTPERRAAVLNLLEHGFQQILYVKGTRQLALCSDESFLTKDLGSAATQRLARDYVGLAAAELAVHTESRFAAKAPEARGVAARERARGPLYGWALAVGLLGMLYVNGGLWGCAFLSWTGFLEAVALLSLVLLGATVAFMAHRLRGTSSGHRQLASVVLAGAVLAPLGSFLALSAANNHLDSAPANEFAGRLEAVREHRKKGRSSYTAALRIMGPADSVTVVDVPVSSSRVDELRAKQGQAAKIWVKPGFLGFKHVTSFEVGP